MSDLSAFSKAAAGVADEYRNAPSESTNSNVKIDWPGRYRVAVKSARKKDGSDSWPSLVQDDKKRWVYKLIFSQTDNHELSPKGASIFHNIYVVAAPDATEDKKANVIKYSKPQLIALSGGNKGFELPQLATDGIDTYDAAGKIIKHHAFTGEYMINVTSNVDASTGRVSMSVTSIEVARDSDSTFVEPRDLPKSAAEAAFASNAQPTLSLSDASSEDDLPF